MHDTIVVIPCFNEAERLNVAAFTAYAAATPQVRFLFVNDGSTDRTAQVLKALEQKNPTAFGVHDLDRNQGKAQAVRAGILEAIKSSPAFVGYWDADLSTPLDQIVPFRDTLLSQPHLVAIIGSRVRLLGRHIHRTAIRHYLGRIFATFCALILGFAVYDTQCGAKLFRVTQEAEALFTEPFLSRWVFDVELLARLVANRRGTDLPSASQVLAEYPLPTWRDVEGSKLRSTHMAGAAIDLMRIWLRYRGGRHRSVHRPVDPKGVPSQRIEPLDSQP